MTKKMKMTTKTDIIKSSPYKPEPKQVIDYIRESPDSFTIRLDWTLRYKPGQFIFCSLPGIGESPISICSSSDDYVELNIREVGNVTKALSKIKKGDTLMVRGPYGKSYPMTAFKGKDIIIIGGGSGVAPLKGAVEYIEKNRSDFKDVYLFFGFRTPDDILFRNKIEDCQRKFSMNISFDKAGGNLCYGGVEGFITQLVDQRIKEKDCKNKIAFICGPPKMTEKTIEILLKKGFNEEQIYISAERLMYCGMGKCGRCMIHGKYTCLDGAVFRYDELKDYKDD